MLTTRQKRLLTLLTSADDWTTSAALGTRLGVSDKLVKQEIASIRTQLGADADIVSRTHKGYRLDYLAPQVREQLGEGIAPHEGHHSINHQYALVYLCLLFQDGFVSTGWLAERLYSSRAAVAEQLEVVRYRVERLPNVGLAVSRRYGFKLQLSESERRHEASKWLQPNCLPALFAGEAEQAAFAQLMNRCMTRTQTILGPIAQAGRLSGEDVRRIGCYLAVSVARSRQGHALVRGDLATAIEKTESEQARLAQVARAPSPAAQTAAQALIDALQAEEGFAATPYDAPVLAALIQDSLAVKEPAVEATALATGLAACAAAWLGSAERACSEPATQQLACEFTSLLRRVRRGHQAFNYHASETVARYPFESCLATWFLRERVALPVPKAEMALLALALTDVTKALRPAPRMLLCTDEAPAFARHLRSELAHVLGVPASSIDACPVEQAKPELLASFGIVATTSQTLAARMPRTLSISAVPTEDELDQLKRRLDDRQKRMLDDRAQTLVHRDADPPATLDKMLEQTSVLASGTPAVVLTAYRRLCIVEAGAEESSIELCELPNDLTYQHKHYKQLVYARWGADDPDPYGFFEILSQVLEGSAS